MKMKEVIAQTGLTDRAIRLYIENGLLAPENQKSHTGRNSFAFTEADIEALQQIALLRKADFSLEQIKALQSGGETARSMLLEFLANKQEAVIAGQQIVEALKDFPANIPVTMEAVCKKIQERIKDKALPEADEKPTKGEKWEKWLLRSFSAMLLFLWVLLGSGAWLTYREDFLFPRLYKNPVNYIGIVYILLPIIAAIAVLVLYRKPVFTKKRRNKRRWLAGTALSIAMLVAVQPVGIAALALVPPVYSLTTNPENYLMLGSYTRIYGEDIFKLFPANIPRSAVAEDSRWYPPDKFPETTKYYYYFQDVIDPSFQIYAEWVLPEHEFAEELERFQSYYPEGPKKQIQWGDWTCMSFTDDTLDWTEAEKAISYYYVIFAYNQETGAVRYIASYSMDSGREEDPYFLYLDWNGS